MEKSTVSLDEAIELLKSGSVGVMPTDTVYGIVARAEDEQAVARLYQAKHRERKPGTLIAASTDQLESLGVPSNDIARVEQWWPGALSAVLPVEGRVYLHQGLGDLAMRVVADPAIRAVLETTGPLITSSANQPGEPGATTVQEAINYFGDAVDFYVDGGDLSGKAPSTIVRPSIKGIEILRQGSIRI